MKRKVIAELDSVAEDDVVIASNSSSFTCGEILDTMTLKNERRFLSAHSCKGSNAEYSLKNNFVDKFRRADWPPETPGMFL